MNHDETIKLLKSGKLSRRQMLKVLAAAGVGVAAGPLMTQQAAATSHVNLTLLEWNGYEYESFHPEFNKKYGGQPEVTFFAATEDAFQKMRAGFKCDLVHPCTGEVNKFRDAGLIKPLETDRIPRWGEVIPYLLTVKGVQSKGESWFAPWDWGYSTVAFNPDTMGVKTATFDIFVDPKYKGKTALDSSIGVNIAIAGVIGGWKEIIPYLLTVKGVQSQGETWFSPWDWGYSTVAFNPDTMGVKDATFDIFVDPKYKGKTALDSSIGVNIAIAGVIGGWKEPLNPTEAEIETAPDIFSKMLETARFVWTDSTQLEQAWAAGDVGASYVYGSASRRMKEEGFSIVVMDPVLPWMCGLCVSSNGAGSEDQAYDYINAMLDPVGGKSLFDEYGYGHANAKTYDLIPKDKLYEKGLNDPEGLLSRGIFFDEVPPAKNAKLLQYWQEAQAGL